MQFTHPQESTLLVNQETNTMEIPALYAIDKDFDIFKSYEDLNHFDRYHNDNPLVQPQDDPQAFEQKRAKYCRHFLHPATHANPILCPDCQTKQHVEALQRHTDLWMRCGAPNHENEARNTSFYWRVCRVWRMEKARLAKHMDRLDILTEAEREWEAKHPEVLDRLADEIKSAGAALEFARKNTPLLNWEDTDAEVKKRPSTGTPKKVHFEAGIVECPKRKAKKFKRGSRCYEPGQWAAERGNPWADTSFANNVAYGSSGYEEVLEQAWDSESEGCEEDAGHVESGASDELDQSEVLGQDTCSVM